MPEPRPAPATEFAIRLSSIDALFFEFDARPVPKRALNDDVHAHLLDEWEDVRDERPSTLIVYAPEAERADTNEEAVATAITTDLEASCEPLRRAGPLSRRERLALWIGVICMFATVALSTVLDRASDDVLVEAIAQGITVVGWVALWGPVAHFVTEVVPHYFNRRRYREFAGVDVRFRWV